MKNEDRIDFLERENDEFIRERDLWEKRYHALINAIRKDLGEGAAREYDVMGMEVNK